MLKGLYSQSACVLLTESAALEALMEVLAPWGPRTLDDPGDHWAFATRPALILSGEPELPRLVEVDVVAERWPDAMGAGPGDEVFDAWVSQAFGPYAWPGGLRRAALHSWSWEDAPAAVDRHGAFIRIRCVHASALHEGLDPGGTYDPLDELALVTEVADALMAVPGALGYFNPNGEVLRDRDGLQTALDHAARIGFPPVTAWCNVRGMNLPGGWAMLDVVGNGQFGLPDLEVCFPAGTRDNAEVLNFAYQITGYLIQHGEVIDAGDTMDGPGESVWQVRRFRTPLSDLPRHVLCFVPQGASAPPDAVLNRAEPGGSPAGPSAAAEPAAPARQPAPAAPEPTAVPRPGRPWWNVWG
ncbi:MAG TPA: DUF4261 domain-containing protein [Longimicrobium sp.]|nr:DUF4261 domain-containing protein [Longimicrobium sp.]